MGETIRSEYSVNDTPDHSNDTTGYRDREESPRRKESGMGKVKRPDKTWQRKMRIVSREEQARNQIRYRL